MLQVNVVKILSKDPFDDRALPGEIAMMSCGLVKNVDKFLYLLSGH